MSSKASQNGFVVAVRVCLGLWFLLFGADKAFRVGPLAFASQVKEFGILQDPWNVAVAFLIPWLEIVAGLCLVIGWSLRGATRMLLGLTFLFLFVSIQAWVRGLPANCGCFGKWFTLDHGPKVALLVVQLLVVVWVMLMSRHEPLKIFKGNRMHLNT